MLQIPEFDTFSSAGQPLRVIVGEHSIVAYGKIKPEVRVFGKEKGIPEKELEEALYREPVMRIDKMDDTFSVDFSAGFQRGRVSNQTVEDLLDEVHVDMYGGTDIDSEIGWLEWIGLSLEDEDQREAIMKFIGKSKSREKLEEVV